MVGFISHRPTVTGSGLNPRSLSRLACLISRSATLSLHSSMRIREFQSLSASTAARGQVFWSKLSAAVSSLQMQASPPKMFIPGMLGSKR